MADNNLNPSAPDLASILRTLSAFSSPPLPSVTPQPQPQLQHTHATPQPQHSQSQNHNRTSSNPPKAETPARPDSTKITSWRPALQYVVHHIAPQPSHLFKIRKLIQVQRTHERQWWEGRVALVQKQEGRIEGKRKLDEVLRAVGGSVDDGGDVSTPEENRAELKRYDIKVRRACAEMETSIETQLKTMGVPFFALSSDRIVSNPSKNLSRKRSITTSGAQDSEKENATKDALSREEVRELKRRMVRFLEDLCVE